MNDDNMLELAKATKAIQEIYFDTFETFHDRVKKDGRYDDMDPGEKARLAASLTRDMFNLARGQHS